MISVFLISCIHGLPLFLLGYLPIRQQLHIQYRRLVPAAVGIYLFCLCLGLYDVSVLYQFPTQRILLSFLTQMGIAFLAAYLTKQSIPFYLFVVFVLKSYTDNIRFAADCIATWLPSSVPEPILLQFSILLITLPLLYFSMRSYLNTILNLKQSGWFWLFMCPIPMGMFLLFRVVIQPDYLGLTSPQSTLLLALVWPAACFFSYFSVLKMYAVTMENDRLARKIKNVSLANASKQEQFHRSTMIYEQTEQELMQMADRLQLLQQMLQHDALPQAVSLLKDWTGQLDRLADFHLCENQAVDGLVRQYWLWAEQSGIQTEAHLDLPEQLPLSEVDFLVIIGNLLENALEACSRQTSGNKFIKVNASAAGPGPVLISVFNSYSGTIHKKSDVFYSSKRENAPGLGVASVCAVAHQYNGYARFLYQDSVFEASVMLNPPLLQEGQNDN